MFAPHSVKFLNDSTFARQFEARICFLNSVAVLSCNQLEMVLNGDMDAFKVQQEIDKCERNTPQHFSWKELNLTKEEFLNILHEMLYFRMTHKSIV